MPQERLGTVFVGFEAQSAAWQQAVRRNITSLDAQTLAIRRGQLAMTQFNRTSGLMLNRLTALAVVAGTVAVRAFARFDYTMAQVQAISEATGDQFTVLRSQAIELGRTTIFTSTQAAEGQLFLARAGFEVNEIYQALPGTLRLAQSSALDLGRSADIVSNVMRGFAISADQTNRFVDVLARTVNSSNTNLEQLGQAMKFVAPAARAVNLTVEETSSLLGALGDAGIQATLAGTNLRQAFIRLANLRPDVATGRATAALEELGIAFDEVDISVHGVLPVIRRIAEEQLTLSQAAAIFGTRAASAFLVIQNSIPDIDEMTRRLREAQSGADQLASALELGERGSRLRGLNIATENIKDLSAALIESGLTGHEAGIRLESFFEALDNLQQGSNAAAQSILNQLGIAGEDLNVRYRGIFNVLDRLENAQLDPIQERIVFQDPINAETFRLLQSYTGELENAEEGFAALAGAATQMSEIMDESLFASIKRVVSALEGMVFVLADVSGAGDGLGNFLDRLAAGIRNATRVMAENLGGLEFALKSLLAIAFFRSGGGIAVRNWLTNFRTMRGAVTTLRLTIVALGRTIRSLTFIGLFVSAIEIFQEARIEAERTSHSLGSIFFTASILGITRVLDVMVGLIESALRYVLAGIYTAFKALEGAVIRLLVSIGSSITAFFSTLFDGIGFDIAGIYRRLTGQTAEDLEAWRNAGLAAAQSFTGAFDGYFEEDIAETFRQSLEALKDIQILPFTVEEFLSNIGIPPSLLEAARNALERAFDFSGPGLPAPPEIIPPNNITPAPGLELEDIEEQIRVFTEFEVRLYEFTNGVGEAFRRFGHDIVQNFDNIGEAVRRFAVRLAQLVLDLVILIPLANALARALRSAFGLPELPNVPEVGDEFPGLVPGRQQGGPAYGLTRVGENGPEYAIFDQPGRVIPFGKIQGALSTGNFGGATFNFAPVIQGSDAESVRRILVGLRASFRAESERAVTRLTKRSGEYRYRIRGR